MLFAKKNKGGVISLKVNVEIDKTAKEIEVLIKTAEMNDKVNNLVQKLSEDMPKMLVGFNEDSATILDEAKIIRIYTGAKKVFAVLEDSKEYTLKIPLYEVVNRLSQNKFVRISNTEVINIKKAVEFDLSFTGTICVRLSNGDTSYVSRRFVTHIKHILGIAR